MKTYLRIWLTIPVLWIASWEKAFTQDQVQTQRGTTPALALPNQLSFGFDPNFKLPSCNPATSEKIQSFAMRWNPKKYFDDTFIFFTEHNLTHKNSEGPTAPFFNPLYAGPRRNAPGNGKPDLYRENRPFFDEGLASRLESAKVSKGRQTLNFLLGTAASVYVSSKQDRP